MAVWPSQVQCSMILTLVDRRSHLCGRVQAVGAISGRRRTSSFRPIWRGPGAGRVPRPCTLHTLKTAYPAHQRPSAASRRPPLPWDGHTAMPRCPPGSMLHSCAEVRERFDPNRPAANHTLPAALIQGHGTGASGTVEETLQPRSTIGCSAWPCKPIVGFVMETDLRPQSKGGRVCKEARSARPRTTVVLIVLNLAPRDLSEASMGCVRVRGWLRRTASPGKLVARLFRCEPWPGPGWAGTRTHWGHRSGKGSLLAACAAEHNE